MKQDDLFNKGNPTLDDMLAIQKSMEKAHEDDTPFPIVTKQGDVGVIGNPNKTEIKRHDYTILFRFPNAVADELNIAEEAIAKRLPSSVYVNIEYTDVQILPRYDLEIQAALVRIFPYFLNIKDKWAEAKTPEELFEETKHLCKEIGDDLYDAVAVIVGVDRDLEYYMDFDCVVSTFTKLINDFPEIVNEAEGFSK